MTKTMSMCILFPLINPGDNNSGDCFTVATIEIKESKSTEVEQQPKSKLSCLLSTYESTSTFTSLINSHCHLR